MIDYGELMAKKQRQNAQLATELHDKQWAKASEIAKSLIADYALVLEIAAQNAGRPHEQKPAD